MTDRAEPTTQPETETQSDRISGRELAVMIARLADEKQGRKIVVLDVEEALQVTDYFVIVEGRNRRHLGAIAESVAAELKKDGIYRMHGTKFNDEHWVVLDFGPVVLHSMSSDAREFYDLENLWGDCDEIEWQAAPDAAPVDQPEAP